MSLPDPPDFPVCGNEHPTIRWPVCLLPVDHDGPHAAPAEIHKIGPGMIESWQLTWELTALEADPDRQSLWHHEQEQP